MTRKPAPATAPKAPRKSVKPSAAAAAKRPPTARPNDPNDHAARIATALEAIATHLAASAPAEQSPFSFADADAFVWHPNGRLSSVPRVSRVEITLLKGIDRMRDILIENTERFAGGLPANNALLWAPAAWANPRW